MSNKDKVLKFIKNNSPVVGISLFEVFSKEIKEKEFFKITENLIVENKVKVKIKDGSYCLVFTGKKKNNNKSIVC